VLTLPRAAVSAMSASADATAPEASDLVSAASHGLAEMMLMLITSIPYVRVTRFACSTAVPIFSTS
jgi:hypothetical protein